MIIIIQLCRLGIELPGFINIRQSFGVVRMLCGGYYLLQKQQ
jgi:hypothetical protein